MDFSRSRARRGFWRTSAIGEKRSLSTTTHDAVLHPVAFALPDREFYVLRHREHCWSRASEACSP